MQDASSGMAPTFWGSVSRPGTEKETTVLLKSIIISFYPHALSQTYCVSPLYFNRMPLRYVSVAGQVAFVHEPHFSSRVEKSPYRHPEARTDNPQRDIHIGASFQKKASERTANTKPNTDKGDKKTTQSKKSSTARDTAAGGSDGAVCPKSVTCNPDQVDAHNTKKSTQTSAPKASTQPVFSMWTQEKHLRKDTTLPKVPDAHLRSDFAQQHMLINFRTFAEKLKKVMFIVSELNFKNYLNKPFYAKGTKTFPKPTRQGDFDLMFITRYHGLLVVELKSVGRTKESRDDVYVKEKVSQAVAQVEQFALEATNLVADIAPGLTVRKSIFLPYVNREQLRRVLSAEDGELGKKMSKQLSVGDDAAAEDLCLCADDVSSPDTYWVIADDVLSILTAWWDKRMSSAKNDFLTDDQYLDIVSRFVGPATTVSVCCTVTPRVEVRTEGQAVSELGRRVARLVLTPEQLDLLDRNEPRVCLTGPPGTGKTVVMVLKALQWLQEGKDVHVVNIDPAYVGIAVTIQYQLTMTLKLQSIEETLAASGGEGSGASHGQVLFHRYYSEHLEDYVDEDLQIALPELVAAAEAKPEHDLFVILDEGVIHPSPVGLRHHKLVQELDTKLGQRLHFWMTAGSDFDIPQKLKIHSLTVPVRYAPAVLREVQIAFRTVRDMDPYSQSSIPFAGDGLKMVQLQHIPGEGPHGSRWPVNCLQCGLDVAVELRRLGVGDEDHTQKGDDLYSEATSSKNSPAPLQYRDVFILTRSSELHDDFRHPTKGSVVTHPASAFVQGLRQANVPVSVLGVLDRYKDEKKWEDDVIITSQASADVVTVSRCDTVLGMERKVVVWLQGANHRKPEAENKPKLKIENAIDRFYSMTRCTTQLLVVEAPLPGEAPGDNAAANAYPDEAIWAKILAIDWDLVEGLRRWKAQFLQNVRKRAWLKMLR